MFRTVLPNRIFRIGYPIRRMSYAKVNGSVIPFPSSNQIPRRHVYIMAGGMFAVWVSIPFVSAIMINEYRKKLGED
ncbi:hypothetical protein RP20_CCG003506 [Aedes albopictus]|nr:hypothetical protein RP20_CCG003506 [Aedes albopictus]